MPRVPKTILLQGRFSTQEIWVNKRKLLPARSLAFLNKSPTGFSWGYGGSGPAQLAFAILLKYLPVKEAMAMHQAFKWKFIATLPEADFETLIPFEEWVESKRFMPDEPFPPTGFQHTIKRPEAFPS